MFYNTDFILSTLSLSKPILINSILNFSKLQSFAVY